VIIISKGHVVARDSVQNLRQRLRGQETVALEVEGRGQPVDAGSVHRKLEQVAGVSRVVHKDSHDSRHLFEIESLQGHHVRGDLARAVVESGWNLNELRTSAVSLEEIFLELTGAEPGQAAGGTK
jgi:ABC-2 type transport system ATP-binding protein